MPRSTNSTRVRGKGKTKPQAESTPLELDLPTQTQETPTMTTTEHDVPSFSFAIEAAPEGYEPERGSPGRRRAPSPFDDVLLQVKDRGWQRVAFENEEMRETILKELHRAKQYLGLGLDLNETDTHVEFRSRDLQKRKPRRKRGEDGNFIEVNEGDAGYDTAEDVDTESDSDRNE